MLSSLNLSEQNWVTNNPAKNNRAYKNVILKFEELKNNSLKLIINLPRFLLFLAFHHQKY